ncbi:MAG: hypothetical protein HY791_33610 [Deltaproteobacteria bacterium]|nr:hypothetical protein [Deltaproteobacteria bacterium]
MSERTDQNSATHPTQTLLHRIVSVPVKDGGMSGIMSLVGSQSLRFTVLWPGSGSRPTSLRRRDTAALNVSRAPSRLSSQHRRPLGVQARLSAADSWERRHLACA